MMRRKKNSYWEIKKFLLKWLIFNCFLLLSLNVCSQGENNNWYFGIQAGLNFSGGTLTVLNNGRLNTQEGCATVSDTAGNLLFYTNGVNVWNKNHALMPNGFGLIGNVSAAQGATIIPDPGNPIRYYIFCSEANENHDSNFTHDYDIAYSVVDMSLDGGLGDIVQSNPTKNTFVQSIQGAALMSGGLPWYEWGCAIPGASGCDSWFCTYKDDHTFNVYKITSSGVNPIPVISSFPNESFAGALTASPNGKKVASARRGYVFDFDPATGKLTFSRKFSLNQGYEYDCAFSPNSSVLYISSADRGIIQLDLNNPNYNMKLFQTPTGYTGIELAADGKIYCALMQSGIPVPGRSFLSVINNPDVVGAGCNFQEDVINLGSKKVALGLPTSVITCKNVLLVSQNVTCKDKCDGALTAYPKGMKPPYTFKWSNGQTTQTVTSLCPGTYTVSVTDKYGFTRSNSFNLTAIYPDPLISAGRDTIIMPGDSVTLSASGDPVVSFFWSPSGSLSCDSCSNPVAKPLMPINYTVTVVDANGCSSSDNVNVNFNSETCEVSAPTAFSPNGDGNNDYYKVDFLCPPLSFHLTIYDRWGEKIFESNDVEKKWDGTIKGKPAEAGVYIYVIKSEIKKGESIVSKELKGNLTLLR
jgi:gliding motility-associated-like protein